MNRKALISIDYTVDFVADDGALTCGNPGRRIENAMVQIVEQFIRDSEYVVFAIDLHHANDILHPETILFPPHNIVSSNGRDLYGALQAIYNSNRDNRNVRWMDKTRYSAFCGTDLYLRLIERDINELHLIGVCTDICVLHTAIDAYNLGFPCVIHKDAVASFDSVGHEWALSHFKNTLGFNIV